MSKDLIIRKPIINFEAALSFAEAKTAHDVQDVQGVQGMASAESEGAKASATDKQANCLPLGDRRSAINFDAALAFAEAKTVPVQNVQYVNATLRSGSSEGDHDGAPSAPMGRRRLTIDVDQWLDKQLHLIAIEQKTTVDEIIEDLVRKYLAKNGFSFGSRGIKVRIGNS
jgi:hypothetical protein